MADKRINDLPAVESLADDGLLPVYQDGGAKRVSGEQLRSFAGMNIIGATVGQIAKITAVNDTGKPTAWEAVDMPSGGGSAVELDTTLSKAGKAADAKAVGDALNRLSGGTGGGGGEGGSGESSVFYAIYGTTTFAEIKAAYDAGKAVYMKKTEGRVVYPLIAITNSFARFAFVEYGGELKRCTCQFVNNDVWREDKSIPLAKTPVSTAVTLSASGWNSSAKTQTVTVSGVLADETKQLITPTPAASAQAAYYNAGIRCTNQAANSLTFTAKTIPAADLTVYVTIQEVSVS